MSRRTIRILFVLCLAVLVSGCGVVGPDARLPLDPDAAVETAVEDATISDPLPTAPDEPPADPDGELVTPTPGMVDVRAVPWEEASIDGATVTVSWWSGVAPCHVLDRVEVEEGDDVVTITLFEGSEPSDEDVACIEVAERKRTEVELSEPVGTRSLADGAE